MFRRRTTDAWVANVRAHSGAVVIWSCIAVGSERGSVDVGAPRNAANRASVGMNRRRANGAGLPSGMPFHVRVTAKARMLLLCMPSSQHRTRLGVTTPRRGWPSCWIGLPRANRFSLREMGGRRPGSSQPPGDDSVRSRTLSRICARSTEVGAWELAFAPPPTTGGADADRPRCVRCLVLVL